MSGLITYRNFDLKDTPSLTGKVALVTGGQAGIGKEIAAQLLLHHISKLYILARSTAKFESAKVYWKEKYGLDVEARIKFVVCDLSDMRAVKKVADQLMEELGRLDILVNNAGVFSDSIVSLGLRNSKVFHLFQITRCHLKESRLYSLQM